MRILNILFIIISIFVTIIFFVKIVGIVYGIILIIIDYNNNARSEEELPKNYSLDYTCLAYLGYFSEICCKTLKIILLPPEFISDYLKK
jgi:hypothetical protein